MIKVLIADDSALMRKMLKQIIESDPEIQVVGAARDGEDVVIKAREYRPDVVTMDVNMPKQDGITALQYIVNEEICPVVMVSSLTQEGAMTTFEALELGAFDFVGKPGGTVSSDMKKVAAEIIDKIRAAAQLKKNRVVGRERMARGQRRPVVKKKVAPRSGQKVTKAVAMGISTGGPKMIYEVVPLIPADIKAALFLVQHMPPNFTPAYVKRLNGACQIEVVEARAGIKVEPGVLYVGSGGRHLNLVKNSTGDAIIRLSSKPDHLFIPSVSVMMQSVLQVFEDRTIGVLMTGMGNDGADTMVKIRQAGGITIAESEESAIVFGMPGDAIKRGGAEIVVPICNIAREIIRAVNR
ncbi:MAG: chemotaxis response regulator protein-glutamate methylesterase [Syntrophomonas sp.]|nr:chemotaxis response regulator protein-glutamate methylesterase [Syntrophomonas sp.]MDD3878549.1 chemotaxis response regulator protein-glutamate methylesterase [Syntrophomonas sp.]